MDRTFPYEYPLDTHTNDWAKSRCDGVGISRSKARAMPRQPKRTTTGQTMRYIFSAHLEDDPNGGCRVTFPDVPEAIAHGFGRSIALARASEALGLALRGYLARGDGLPVPQAAGGVPVEVDAGDALKLAVIEAFNASGISKTELGRRLGRSENEARRILDPDYPSKLEIMQNALAVFGKRIIVEIADVP